MSVDSLSIDERGLSAAEVAERVARGAVNRVKDRTSRSVASIIRENVLTLFNAIIVAASVIVLLFGDLRDGIFGGVMIINAVIGIVSELRAKRTLDSLAIVDAPQATVLRGGALSVVPARDVVLDDVIDLTLGDQVSVDGTVLSAVGLEIDESLLATSCLPARASSPAQGAWSPRPSASASTRRGCRSRLERSRARSRRSRCRSTGCCRSCPSCCFPSSS